MKKKKVGILTLYYRNYNVGALLQSYALQRSVSKMGFCCEQITYQWYGDGYERFLQKINKSDYKEFMEFENSIPHSEVKYTRENIIFANDEYDVFIAGSDQIWNDELGYSHKLSPQEFCLGFVEESKVRAFYAASIGKTYVLPQTHRLWKRYLPLADKISVRENSSREYLTELIPNQNVEVVLDPVFLLDDEDWRELSIRPRNSKPYILVYLLGNDSRTQQILNYAKEIAAEKGWDVVILPKKHTGPREFLGLVDGAEFVFSSSFHGTVFCILFHKPFVVFGHRSDDDPQQTNARMYDLCRNFHLQQFIGDTNALEMIDMNRQYDFKRSDEILDWQRKQSWAYLQQVLSVEKDDFFVTEKKNCYGCGQCISVCPTKAISMQSDEEEFLYPVIDCQQCDQCGICIRTCPARILPKRVEKRAFSILVRTNDKNKEESIFTEVIDRIKMFGMQQNTPIRTGNGCSLLQDKRQDKNEVFVELPCKGSLSPKLLRKIQAIDNLKAEKEAESEKLLNHFYKEGNGFRLCCTSCFQRGEVKGDVYLQQGNGSVMMFAVTTRGTIFLETFASWEKKHENETLIFTVAKDAERQKKRHVGEERTLFFTNLGYDSIEKLYYEKLLQREREKASQELIRQQYRYECSLVLERLRRKFFIEKELSEADRIVIYGAGVVGRDMNHLLKDCVLCFIDQAKAFDTTHTLDGKNVYHLEDLNLWHRIKREKKVRIIITPGWDFDKIKSACQKIFINRLSETETEITYNHALEFLREQQDGKQK